MLARPKPQCHCVRILREQRNPAASLPLPLSPAQSIVPPVVRQRPSQRLTKKKRTEAQNERPVLPQENGRRQTAVQFDPHLPTSRTQDPVDMTWHCYTRCSSCGLTTGSICDRRRVNFLKTFYTHFPRIFSLRRFFDARLSIAMENDHESAVPLDGANPTAPLGGVAGDESCDARAHLLEDRLEDHH